MRSGRLGDVFHYESFVGGYGHPCNYWHSDEAVSGGAVYDWGSHYLDWVLDLFPQPVEWVSATTHKRVWHDVTNADHSRVLVHFAGGREAEFTHSDLAAARKPKFYVLGTEGALVGDWRYERVVQRSAIGTLLEDRLMPSDSPADLRVLHARRGRRDVGDPAQPAARAAGPVPPRARRPGAVRLADVGDSRGQPQEHRGHAGRDRVRRRRRPPGAAARMTDAVGPAGPAPLRWGFVGAGRIATDALAPAVHAAAGRRPARGGGPRSGPRRSAAPGPGAPDVRRPGGGPRGGRGLHQPAQRRPPAVDAARRWPRASTCCARSRWA